MAQEAETEEEPSIEEILDSIRQIISDDDEEEGAVEATETSAEPEVDPVLEPDPDPAQEPEAVSAAAPEPDFAAEVEQAMQENEAADEEDIIELTDPAEGPVEEPVEEPAEEPAEEVTEASAAPEVKEEPAEEPIAEPESEAAEEPVAEPAEEPVAEPAEKPVEEPVEDEVEVPAPPPMPEPEQGEDDNLLTDNAENAALGAFAELKKKTAVETGGITVEDIVRSEIRPLLRDWLDRNLPSMVERLVREEIERVSQQASDE